MSSLVGHCFLAKQASEVHIISLMIDLILQGGYEHFVQMTFMDSEYLLNLVAPFISKIHCVGRAPLSPREMLAATLWF